MDFNFYDPKVRTFFETGNAHFLEDIELGGRDKVEDFVFEEEVIPLPPVVISHDQVFIPSHGEMANPVPQDNIEILLDQVQNIQEDQAQQPQEPVPLRRSTRERRSAIPNDYIVFLQEHEADIGMEENDPINLRQAIESPNAQVWINGMNDEIKSKWRVETCVFTQMGKTNWLQINIYNQKGCTR